MTGISVALAMTSPVWLALFMSTVEPRATAELEPSYDVRTVVEVDATVVEIRSVPAHQFFGGVHLLVTVEGAKLDVFLGPHNFVKEFNAIPLSEGGRVQIAGSKVKTNAGPVLLAREVRKGGTTFYLRNGRGDPYWQR